MQFNISLKKKKLTKALHIFEKVLVESLQKSEAHYFCGYGIDRLYILNEQDSATSDFIMPATYAGTEQELPKKVVARDKMLDEKYAPIIGQKLKINRLTKGASSLKLDAS